MFAGELFLFLFKLTLEEVMTTTAYLDLFLRSITEPALLQTFLSFILLHTHDNVHILDTLVSRVNTPFQVIPVCAERMFWRCNIWVSSMTPAPLWCPSVRYGVAGSVSDSDWSVLWGCDAAACVQVRVRSNQGVCSAVTTGLRLSRKCPRVYRYLIPCSHLSRKQRCTLHQRDCYSTSAATFLLLIPSLFSPSYSQSTDLNSDHIHWPKGSGDYPLQRRADCES